MLLNDPILDPRDIMSTSLPDSCALWPKLIHQSELAPRESGTRLSAKMDLIGQTPAQAMPEPQGPIPSPK